MSKIALLTYLVKYDILLSNILAIRLRLHFYGGDMYTDYSPVPNYPRHENYRGHQVVVIEGGESGSEVIRFARRNELTTINADGNEIFWIVFSNDPRQLYDFTAKALRRSLWSMRQQSCQR